MKPLAFSPGSITAYFQIEKDEKTGLPSSAGLSINIREGVTASVKENREPQIIFNGKPIQIPTVEMVVQQLSPTPVYLELSSLLAIGCGFGVSAAAALSTAFALNAHFKLGKTKMELEKMAFLAEIENKTGVGDVAAQINGGIVFRHVNGADPTTLMLQVPDFYCSVYGPISTKSVLQSASALEKINRAGEKSIDWMNQKMPNTTWDDLLQAASLFSRGCGLLTKEVEAATQKIEQRGGKAFMIMIGNSLVSTIPDENSKWMWKTNLDLDGTRLL